MQPESHTHYAYNLLLTWSEVTLTSFCLDVYKCQVRVSITSYDQNLLRCLTYSNTRKQHSCKGSAFFHIWFQNRGKTNKKDMTGSSVWTGIILSSCCIIHFCSLTVQFNSIFDQKHCSFAGSLNYRVLCEEHYNI